MFNLGLTPPPPSDPPEGPRDLIRGAVCVVDRKLRESTIPGRLFFSPREVQDLLLDVRNVLDTLTSPANLIMAAQQIAQETQGKWEQLGEAGE